MHSTRTFWKEMKIILKWYNWSCRDFFGILYIACRHTTKHSKAYLLPYLYVGMPWGGHRDLDIELRDILAIENIFFYCHIVHLFLYVFSDISTLWHASLFWNSDTRFYHMLGRRDIRSLHVFTFPLLYCLFFWWYWQPGLCGYAH